MNAPQRLTYEEFGRRFFEAAVTPERVAATLGSTAGSGMRMGPMKMGPGNLAKVTADVTVGEPTVTRYISDVITMDALIPLHVVLKIDLILDKQRFDVSGSIRLPMTVQALAPLHVFIDIAAPEARDVDIDVQSHSFRGQIIGMIGDIEGEVKRFVAEYIREELAKPEVLAARLIDVAAEMEAALDESAKAAPPAPATTVTPTPAKPTPAKPTPATTASASASTKPVTPAPLTGPTASTPSARADNATPDGTPSASTQSAARASDAAPEAALSATGSAQTDLGETDIGATGSDRIPGPDLVTR